MSPLWARLDIRHFVSLSAVVRTGSFTAAAESLGYTQSAVSQQIDRLEKLINGRVVNRSVGGRPVSLTPAGRVLMEHAATLTSTLQELADEVLALSQGQPRVLRVGCFESVGANLLPAALAGFVRAFPDIRVELTELPDDGDLLERLERDELDLTFVVFPLPEGPFEARALLEDPYVLVAAEGSALAQADGPIVLDDYPDIRLMTYAELRPVHSMVSRVGRPSYAERVVFRSNHTATLLSLAAEGHGVAFVPRLAVEQFRPGIRIIELARVSPRIIGIAWRHHQVLSEPAAAFVQAAEANADRMSARTS
ncbi:LysR family transcriptional regulator [Amycolatopsis benzoatilytica]|uniref:LysR family transcriptional regulator n=1 Tax=Amycolatopsis benzoatilytica TaxID=346045 RepID=UPI0003A3EB17|nr:LysR family transcriptional regulator [Amycolatopsis benzoatilytica]